MSLSGLKLNGPLVEPARSEDFAAKLEALRASGSFDARRLLILEAAQR